MKYSESSLISDEIKKSKKILINLHRGPDGDSIGSALGLSSILEKIGKEVSVVYTNTSRIAENYLSVPNINTIKQIDFSTFNFDEYDLFIIPDTSEWIHVTDNEDALLPKITTIVIDHHINNSKFGTINLIDAGKSSCSEIIYLLAKDLDLEIDKTSATLLLLGMLTDTGMFRFSKNPDDLIHAAELMNLGADKEFISKNIMDVFSFSQIKIYGEFISRLELDKKYNFMYTSVPYEIYEKYNKPAKVSSTFSTLFASSVNDIDFGIVMLEREKNIIDISFRSRKFDVSRMAKELGGGGHINASGGCIKGMSFNDAVENVLMVAKKYASGNITHKLD